MKKFLILIFFLSFSFANEGATKNDIKMLIDIMKENNRQIDKRLEQVDKRFEQVDKRFEDMYRYSEKSFEKIYWIFGVMITILLTGFGWIIAYLMKERVNIKTEIEKELKYEIDKKANIDLVEKIITIFEEFAKTNKDVAKILKKHNINTNLN